MNKSRRKHESYKRGKAKSRKAWWDGYYEVRISDELYLFFKARAERPRTLSPPKPRHKAGGR